MSNTETLNLATPTASTTRVAETPRQRLMSAAARLFRSKGYDRTTVRDIAQEVGILSGSIFHHFRNKDELLRAVMEDSVTRLLASSRRALAQANTPEQRLKAMIRCDLEAVVGEQGNALTVLVFEWRALSPESQAAILLRREEYEQLWQQELDNARPVLKQGIDPIVMRRFLGGALYWTTHWYQPDGDYNIEQLTDQALRLILE